MTSVVGDESGGGMDANVVVKVDCTPWDTAPPEVEGFEKGGSLSVLEFMSSDGHEERRKAENLLGSYISQLKDTILPFSIKLRSCLLCMLCRRLHRSPSHWMGRSKCSLRLFVLEA